MNQTEEQLAQELRNKVKEMEDLMRLLLNKGGHD